MIRVEKSYNGATWDDALDAVSDDALIALGGYDVERHVVVASGNGACSLLGADVVGERVTEAVPGCSDEQHRRIVADILTLLADKIASDDLIRRQAEALLSEATEEWLGENGYSRD